MVLQCIISGHQGRGLYQRFKSAAHSSARPRTEVAKAKQHRICTTGMKYPFEETDLCNCLAGEHDFKTYSNSPGIMHLENGHGKEAADGVGGVLKRTRDRVPAHI